MPPCRKLTPMNSSPTDSDLVRAFNDAYAELTAAAAPFSWTEQEIRGASVRVFNNAPANMRAVWEAASRFGDKEYLVYGDERYSYAEADARVRALAHYLRTECGAVRGTRVAISMRNYPEWILAHWAAISVGASVVGMNSWWTTPEMEFALQDTKPVALIVDGERLRRLGVADLNTQVIASRINDGGGGREHEGEGQGKGESEGELPDNVVHWHSVTDPEQTPTTLPAAEIDPDDDALIFYTSGTTGFPKGARLTHRAVAQNLLNVLFTTACGNAARARWLTDDNRSDTPEPSAEPDVVTSLLTVPLFHATGCNCVMQPVTLVGGRLVLMYRWDSTEALRLIERERVTVLTGVPTMSRELLQHPDWSRTDTSSMRSLGGGGAALPADLARRIDEGLQHGHPGVGYGLTEVAGVATAISSEFYLAKPFSVGPPMPCMEAKIIDDEGATLDTGEPGELALRGPNLMKGYLNQPEATAEAIVDGWLHTGDVAEIDDDGWIHIRDRIKDIVIRGGENIHCSEVEAVIYELDEVAEVAVFGVPDERLGEEVAAAVVAAPGARLDRVSITEHLEGRLARFKHPSQIWFLDEPLPRNANGKFLKRELRERFSRATS